jgi:endonuclease-3 related protein
MIGAVLTQNTAWTNVERAISNLKQAGLLEFDAMLKADDTATASLIRPAGYFNIKAKRLRNLLDAIEETGGLEAFFEMETSDMRELLLSVNGIGPETADSICCYGACRPEFVVDAYTKRLLLRHGFIDDDATYQSVKGMFMKNLPPDVQLFKDLHAWVVFVGKDFCRKRKPDCGGCPISSVWGTGKIKTRQLRND